MCQKTRTSNIPGLLLCVVLSVSISGCTEKEAAFDSRAALSASTPASTPTTSLTLTWGAPTTYTDNTVLLETDIKAYKVYYSTLPITQTATAGIYTVSRPDSTSALTPTSLTVSNNISLATGTYFFVVTAVDKNGAESDFSNEVSKYIY